MSSVQHQNNQLIPEIKETHKQTIYRIALIYVTLDKKADLYYNLKQIQCRILKKCEEYYRV